MSRVLHAKWDYVYQLGLLTTELREIFDSSPLPDSNQEGDSSNPRNRKPVEGDCPICYCEFEEHEHAPSSDYLVWCKAACGQNFHKTCFRTWAVTKCGPGREAEATCPMCRSIWGVEGDLVKKVKTQGPVNKEGYVNVADQLGISGFRGKLGRKSLRFPFGGRKLCVEMAIRAANERLMARL
jgi:hypothetical protein